LDIPAFVDSAIGLPVSHAWKGHGSTVFFELGELAPGRKRRDGSTGNPVGQYTLFIEPNWRIEGPRSILCGSDDSRSQILRALEASIGVKTEHIYISGHLPELEVVFSNGRRLKTFSAWKGQPGWTIHRWSPQLALYSQFGQIKLDGGAPNNSFKPNPLRGSA
jgi:hypothetical protein